MSDNIIQVKGLKKHYNGGEVRALDGVDIDIARGEVVVIIGPSGSGKSTLLRSLNLLEMPTEGEIIFDGVNINDKDVNINVHRQKMGMVFQHFNLFPHMTILKNLTIAPIKLLGVTPEDAKKRAMELLTRVGLADRADAYPSQLSGGQKQRVAIAGILAMQPQCIILDEPTAMLDPKGRQEVMDTVLSLNRDKNITIVLITHYMDEAAKADRVIVLDRGKVVLDDAPQKVFEHEQELISLGLNVPDSTALSHRLRECGIELRDGILTPEECAQEILRQRKTK